MKTMDTAANLIFRSISAIYEGTISSSTLYPTLFSGDDEKKYIFYGFRLREVIPSRLIVRIYEENKNTLFDMLWLVDDSKIEGKGNTVFSLKSSKMDVEGSPKDFIKRIQVDATIKACYGDLEVFDGFFDMAIVGSKDLFPSKFSSQTQLNIDKVPTQLYAFSRCKLNSKKIKNEDYQSNAINGFLALIDLIHRSLELLFLITQENKKSQVFCIRCGQQLPLDSYYCPICGSKQN